MMFDYARRRGEAGDRMRQAGIDLLFLPISGDLEYLTGIPRREPSFGNVAYRHGWVAGAFLRPGADPVVVLPRMITEFELPGGAGGDVVIVHETDDGDAVLARIAAGLGPVRSLAVGARTWAETLIHLRQALSDPAISNADDLISPLRRIKSHDEMERMAVAARIVDEVMAVVGPQVIPGVTASEVDRASRQVIEGGGYGKWFRHRTGHAIGLDVHEYPFISEEDQTPLEPGMTFTIEPSVFWPGHVGARIEDIVVCEANGARKLNRYAESLVVND